MATFDLGRVTPLYKGDYNASASYELNDVVLYNGNLYWHVQATATVGILPTDTTVWKLAFADEGVRAEIRGYADDAQASADSALSSKNAAATSASNASASASQAALSAQTASTKASEASTSAQTASTKASEAAVSAQSAASSAQTATDKATLASQKAAAASESASLSTAKASAAATSEINAAASAQTATAKASEAAASATSAQEYYESAQASAVNAQTAQGLAETAQTAAETAQGLAEDARDLAQQYAESIDPEHIYSAYPTDTAEGSIASFADGADDIPLKSLVVNIDPVQSGSGDPSPTNVRPISGWSEVNVQRTGVNLWNGLNYTSGLYLTDTGDRNANTLYGYTDYIPVAPDSTYYVSGISGSNPSICWYDNGKNFIGGEKNNSETSKFISMPSNAHFIRVSFLLDNVDTLMVNYPATDHDYHPYSGQSINIQLGQTVYGGTLDVVSGVLTVDYEHLLFDGSETWDLQSINSHGIANFAMTSVPSYAKPIDLICNRLPLQTSVIAETTTEGVFPAGNTNIYIRVNSSRASTVAELKQWLTSNNVEVVYKIRTPLTIQLSPHEIKTLLGQNNLWADTGNTEVEYRADATLYIKRLTESDTDMIADANIVSGQYFMVGNSLYLATSNIASGSAVIVGTNCTQKSLSEALNEINQ